MFLIVREVLDLPRKPCIASSSSLNFSSNDQITSGRTKIQK